MRDVVPALVLPVAAALERFLAFVLPLQGFEELLRIDLDVILDITTPQIARFRRRVELRLRSRFVRLVHRALVLHVVHHELLARERGFDAALARAIRVLHHALTTRVTPLTGVPVRAPNLGVILQKDILLVTTLHRGFFGSLDETASAVVLDVLLRLTERQTVGKLFARARVAVLFHDVLFIHSRELFLLFFELLVQRLGLRRRALHVNGARAAGFRLLPCVTIQTLKLHHLPVISRRVITAEEVVFGIGVRRRILAHRARLWVVVRRIHIQVAQIFRRVFAKTQVTHRAGSAPSGRAHRAFDVCKPRRRLIRNLRVVVVVVVGARIVRIRVARRVVLLFIRPPKRAFQLFLLGQFLLHRVRRLVSLHHLDVIIHIESVIPIALTLKPKLQLRLHVLVRRDVLLRLARASRARPLHAILLLVRHRSAILARPLTKFRRLRRRHASLVPLRALFGFFRRLLMFQSRPVLLQVPRRRRHELRNVRVDRVPVLIDLVRDQPSLERARTRRRRQSTAVARVASRRGATKRMSRGMAGGARRNRPRASSARRSRDASTRSARERARTFRPSSNSRAFRRASRALVPSVAPMSTARRALTPFLDPCRAATPSRTAPSSRRTAKSSISSAAPTTRANASSCWRLTRKS